MYIRVSRVSRRGKTYEYAQLVESYRRDDGKPAHRVLHSFGRVEEPLLSNLKAAFQGSQKGQLLQPAVESLLATPAQPPPRPHAALRYLDVAVVLEVFRDLGLDELLGQLVDDPDAEVADHKVIAALVAQRCVAPGSKLAATRWFPTTALPELLAVAVEQFNNTRLHRVLSRLEASTDELMRAVAQRCVQQGGGVRTLYLDITDTWFVGQGPELAVMGKTKEGMLQRKIGIVLLCSEQGYPLRWKVLQGTYCEADAMVDLLGQLRHQPWLHSAPVICDRAMGRTAYLQKLVATQLPFITAMATPEIQTYYPDLAVLAEPLRHVQVTSEEQLQGAKDQACKLLQSTAMTQVDDTHFVLDAGIVEPSSDSEVSPPQNKADGPGDALRAALAVTELVRSGRFGAYADAYRHLGVDPKQHRNLRGLVRLPEDLQQRVLAGEFAGHSASRLARIAALPDEQAQRRAFEAWAHRCPKVAPVEPTPSAEPSKPPRVRAVLSFNPEVFAQQRLTAHGHLQSIQREVAELNTQLAQPRSNMTKNGVEHRIDSMLRRKNLLKAFDIEIKSVPIHGKQRFQVALTLNEQDWRQRRRTDGFTLFVANPDLAKDAEKILALYRAKDTVETDFQVIKSHLQLRPVRHHTDLKVRAHVSLCMLALLVERVLRRRLGKAGTAAAALEVFEPVRLCHFPSKDGKDAYVPTQPSPAASRLLRKLKLLRLIDPGQVATTLTPRPLVVTTKSPGAA